jgi:hypothetical protein
LVMLEGEEIELIGGHCVGSGLILAESGEMG